MAKKSTQEKRLQLSRDISAHNKHSTLYYYLDSLLCAYRHGSSPENYYALRFFEKNDRERSRYLTSGRSIEINRLTSASPLPEERKKLALKHIFDRSFPAYVKRDHLYTPDCSYADFLFFLDRHPVFFCKPIGGTMGSGIRKISRTDVKDPVLFFEQMQNEKRLLEEPIIQHPDLSRLNPDCINTIRVNTLRASDGSIYPLGACLKVGGPGSITDNFHTGGAAFPIDLERGLISGPGRDNHSLNSYEVSPANGEPLLGMVLPFFADTISAVCSAADQFKSIGYIGWDVAITPDGPELIEGNFNWPGGNIIQFDNIGKYETAKKLLCL